MSRTTFIWSNFFIDRFAHAKNFPLCFSLKYLEIKGNIFDAYKTKQQNNLTPEIHMSWLYHGDIEIRDTFVYEYTPPSHLPSLALRMQSQLDYFTHGRGAAGIFGVAKSSTLLSPWEEWQDLKRIVHQWEKAPEYSGEHKAVSLIALLRYIHRVGPVFAGSGLDLLALLYGYFSFLFGLVLIFSFFLMVFF